MGKKRVIEKGTEAGKKAAAEAGGVVPPGPGRTPGTGQRGEGESLAQDSVSPGKLNGEVSSLNRQRCRMYVREENASASRGAR